MKRVWESPPARFVRDVAGLYFDRQLARSAAELAYFLILSFFPLLICVSAIMGFFQLNVNDLLDSVSHLIPQAGMTILRDYVGYLSGAGLEGGMLAAGLAMVVFSASAAFRGLMNIVGEIYGEQRYRGVKQIVASVVFSLGLLAVIYLSLVVLLTGRWFLHMVSGWFPWVEQVLERWQWMRFLLMYLIMQVFILLAYRVCIPKHRPVLLGSVAATVALVVSSAVFSYFIGMSSQYSLVYGSLASVIILLIWLFLCGNIIILGAAINYVHQKHRT